MFAGSAIDGPIVESESPATRAERYCPMGCTHLNTGNIKSALDSFDPPLQLKTAHAFEHKDG